MLMILLFRYKVNKFDEKLYRLRGNSSAWFLKKTIRNSHDAAPMGMSIFTVLPEEFRSPAHKNLCCTCRVLLLILFPEEDPGHFTTDYSPFETNSHNSQIFPKIVQVPQWLTGTSLPDILV